MFETSVEAQTLLVISQSSIKRWIYKKKPKYKLGMIIKSNEINIKRCIRSKYTQGRRCVKKQKLQNCPSPSKYLHSYESVDTTLWRK